MAASLSDQKLKQTIITDICDSGAKVLCSSWDLSGTSQLIYALGVIHRLISLNSKELGKYGNVDLSDEKQTDKKPKAAEGSSMDTAPATEEVKSKVVQTTGVGESGASTSAALKPTMSDLSKDLQALLNDSAKFKAAFESVKKERNAFVGRIASIPSNGEDKDQVKKWVIEASQKSDDSKVAERGLSEGDNRMVDLVGSVCQALVEEWYKYILALQQQGSKLADQSFDMTGYYVDKPGDDLREGTLHVKVDFYNSALLMISKATGKLWGDLSPSSDCACKASFDFGRVLEPFLKNLVGIRLSDEKRTPQYCICACLRNFVELTLWRLPTEGPKLASSQ